MLSERQRRIRQQPRLRLPSRKRNGRNVTARSGEVFETDEARFPLHYSENSETSVSSQGPWSRTPGREFDSPDKVGPL